jgi:hypothetical protein
VTYTYADVEPGRHLDPPVRTALERVVGADLAGVTVHEGPRSSAAAAARGARAFTSGHHVVLGRGDLPTLGHELTHVLQQRRTGTRVQHAPPFGSDTLTGDTDEDDARLVERQLRHGGTLPYRQAIASLPPQPRPPVPPVGERVRDTRTPVFAADLPRVDRLRQYLVDVRTAVETALTTDPPRRPWLTVLNDNVLDVLRVVDALVGDIASSRLVIRFDQGLGQVQAAYDSANDLMHLRPFTTEAELRATAATMVHEFTHTRQARATEARVAARLAPEPHPPAAELKQEVDARRNDVYFTGMADAVGLGSGALSLSDEVFRHEFETARTAPDRARDRRTHAEALDFAATYEPRAEAARDRRDAVAARREATTIEREGRQAAATAEQTIRDAYTGQLATNAPSRDYPVELMPDDSLVLHRGAAGDVRLGTATNAAAASTDALRGEVDRLLRAWSGYATLFRDGRQRLPVALVTVVYQGRVLTRVGIAP